MFYDMPPEDYGPAVGPDGLKLSNYVSVLNEVSKVMPKSQIQMGFEPGTQADNGVWEGAKRDI